MTILIYLYSKKFYIHFSIIKNIKIKYNANLNYSLIEYL